MHRFFFTICFWLLAITGFAQQSPFQITLEPLVIKDMPGLQSFAFGHYNGEWLLVGGRVDGLHRRQPFAAFDSAGGNAQFVVVNPETKEVWTAGLQDLPAEQREQLSATNPEFCQDGKMLYFVGGYGYSATAGDHKTFGNLTAIDVPATIQAVKDKTPLAPHIRQVADERFAITGGQMEKKESTFFLIGGHNFQGRYNPNGPDHGPGFVQHYNTELIQVAIDGSLDELNYQVFKGPKDSIRLHRRDFNVLPQILRNQRPGLMIFSGVFQYKADIPYLDCMEFGSNGLLEIPFFQQHYQQYHCAKVPLHSSNNEAMHFLFFGGISEYYDIGSEHVLDCNVPFIKTIARVTRDADGRYHEYKLPVEMPDYLGASAEFILAPDVPKHPNGVVKLDELPAEKTLLGYIVGGIESSDDNIFWVNEGEHSKASTRIYQVFIRKSAENATDYLQTQSESELQLEVLPDPYKGILSIDFHCPDEGSASLQFTTLKGRKLIAETLSCQPSSDPAHYEFPCKALLKGGQFYLTLKTAKEELKLRVIVEP